MAAQANASRGLASWRRTTWGELLAEGLGTFVLICFGDGVVAMAVAALNQSGRGTEIFAASGDWLIIGWGWGFAVTFGVYVAGGISGAHINPAVTLAFAARRDFPWRKVPGYIAAQLVGAFLGALLVYIVYKGAIDSYERAHHITRGDPDSLTTFSIFATFPAGYLHTWVEARYPVDGLFRGMAASEKIERLAILVCTIRNTRSVADDVAGGRVDYCI